MSKIQIWKRITTLLRLWNIQSSLYLICQRYKFESESQLSPNSNPKPIAVFNMSKIQIWKRITTMHFRWILLLQLYLICQRYKFESESQLACWAISHLSAVFNMSKIQIWKRITTRAFSSCCSILLYLICQRYKFESESQPEEPNPSINDCCI